MSSTCCGVLPADNVWSGAKATLILASLLHEETTPASLIIVLFLSRASKQIAFVTHDVFAMDTLRRHCS
jgi:hypothetical protein